MEGGAGTPHGGRLLDHQRALPDAVTGAGMPTASLHASPSTGHAILLADGGGGGGAGGVDGVRHASRPGRYVAALLALSLVAVCMCMAWQSVHPQATSSSMHHPSLRHIRTARVLSAQPFYVPPGDVVAAAYRGPAHTASWGAAMPAAAAVPGVVHVGDSNAQVLCGLDTASTTPYAFENGAANAIEVVLCASSHDCEKKVSCVPHIPPHSTATLNVPSGYDLMVVLFCDPSGSPCMGEHTWSSTLGPQGWTRPLVLPFMGSPYCNTASGQDFCTATQTCMTSDYNPDYSKTWQVCVECPRNPATQAICSDRGACAAAPDRLGGSCACNNGWTGAACNLTVVPPMNCSSSNATGDAVYRFSDESRNPLRVQACDDGSACAAGHASPCTGLVAANTTRDLVAPATTNYVQATVCSAVGQGCFDDYVVGFQHQGVRDWSPPLSFADPGFTYCVDTEDCPGATLDVFVATTPQCVLINGTTAHPTWKACIDCPMASDGAVCNGHGTCSGTGVGATGVCQCVDGWSARACTQPAYRLVNCTPSDTADIITAEFVNGAANPLRATTCAGTKCTSATAHPCAEVLPQHASMTLWMPGATTRLVVQVCNPGASSNASCTDLTQEFTLSAGVWSPPLELPHTSQVYCEDMNDCDGQELCLPNHQGLGEPWNVCVECPTVSPWNVPCSGHGSCQSQPTGLAGNCTCIGGWTGAACNLSPHPTVSCTGGADTLVALPFANNGANTLDLTVCAAGDCVPCSQAVAPGEVIVLEVDPRVDSVSATFCVPTGSPCLTGEDITYVLDETLGQWVPPLETPATEQVYCEINCEQVGARCLPSNHSSSQVGPLWPDWDVCINCPISRVSKTACNGHGTCSAPQTTSDVGYCTCFDHWSGEDCSTPPPNNFVNCAGTLVPVESFVFRNPSHNFVQLTACSNNCATSSESCASQVAPGKEVNLLVPMNYNLLVADYCVDAEPVGHAQQSACTSHSQVYRKDDSTNNWSPALAARQSNLTFCSEDTDCPTPQQCLAYADEASRWQVCAVCPGVNTSSGVACNGHGTCYAPQNTAGDTLGSCSCSDDYSGADCQTAPHHKSTVIPWYWFVLGSCGFLVLVCGTVWCVHMRRRKGDMAVMDGAGQVLLDKNLSLPRAMKKQDHVIEFRKITIGEKIAAGSNATVYKGMYLGVPVALKEIYYSVFDMQAVEHFRQEAAILGNLHHPHIVRLFGVCHRSPHLYLVTELMQTSLQRLLHGAPIPLETRLRIAVQICYGMAFLHSVKIVHRDLKPGNVLLDNELNVKICDFGLARPSSHGDMTGFLGTPAYMAPETMGGPRVKYSKTVDMYAFGVMCSELLTWSRAYHDVNVPSVFALRDKVVNQRLRPTIPSHIRDASPTTRLVANLCERCWSAEPDERPTFADVTVELEDIINNPHVAPSVDGDSGEEEGKGVEEAEVSTIGSGTAGGSRARRVAHVDPNVEVDMDAVDCLSALSELSAAPSAVDYTPN